MRNRPRIRFELLGCALHGHVTVGEDAEIAPDADRALVRDLGGLRWCRCLRCDSWIPVAIPEHPSQGSLPNRDDLTIPLRGPALRDRYVLRLIAVERAIHVLVFGGLALVVFIYLGHRSHLLRDFNAVMNALTGASNGSGAGIAHPHGFMADLRRYLLVSPTRLWEVGIALAAYAALESVEMVGLWFAKRWAEYLTFLATLLFIPLEIAELLRSVSTLKVLTFIVNVAVAAYLLWGKRLFGLRGGGHTIEEARRRTGGWEAIVQATPL